MISASCGNNLDILEGVMSPTHKPFASEGDTPADPKTAVSFVCCQLICQVRQGGRRNIHLLMCFFNDIFSF